MQRFVGEEDMLRWSPVRNSRLDQAFRCPLSHEASNNPSSIAYLRMCNEEWVLRVVTADARQERRCLGRAVFGNHRSRFLDVVVEANYWLRESYSHTTAVAN